MSGFAAALLEWFDRAGRHDLPWQHPREPYRVWLAEVMLQQTQVATVVGYFNRFVAALPTLAALAAAGEDEVLALWSGLGYYRRARNLHRAAQICVAQHGGALPRDLDALRALPGIGRSTAAAILAQAHGDRHAILDGNVKRVLTRSHGIDGWPGEAAVEARLWSLAEALTPDRRVADYTQAIMDLGATVCVRSQPRCDGCPLAASCIARRDNRIAGLPARRPARPKPTRATAMLVLVDRRGRVLLERRPPEGVWPGLWSLPEAPPDEARQYAIKLAAIGEPATDPPPAFEHVFSHFKLRVTPFLWCDAKPESQVGEGDARRWLGVDEWRELGLPAPVRRLLESLSDSAGETAPSRNPRARLGAAAS